MRFLKRIVLAVIVLGGLTSAAEASRWDSYLHLFPFVPTPQNGTIDPNGNRLSQIETNAGRTERTSCTYDPVNQLETVTYQPGTR